MWPIVIADSDDDIDEREYSPPPQPNQATATSDTHARSSDRVSHATVSTDPAFFQSVFNEQNEAAACVSLRMGAAKSAGASPDALSSEPVRPAGQVAASSRTPGPDSAHRRVSGKKSAQGDTSSPSLRNQGSPEEVAAKDMWDVPSSPESKAASGPSRTKASRAKAVASVKITRGLRKNLEGLGYESEDEAKDEEGGGRGSGPIASVRAQKRRRLDSKSGRDMSRPGSTGGSPKSVGEFPDKPAAYDTTTGHYEPTLPIDNQSSFLVAPKPLTDSQKVEYQSIDLVQSSPCTRLPEVPHPKMGSSGTATNLNTPRSDMTSSHDIGPRAPTPESERVGRVRRIRPPPRRMGSSSPDVIASTSHVQDQGPPNKQPSDPVSAADAALDGDGLDAESEERLGNDDADLAVPPEPPKTKRQRGRPKKSAANGSGKQSSAAASVDTHAETADMPKKKRGRPKKTKPPPEAEQTAPGHIAPEADAPAGVRELGDVDAAQDQPEEATTGSGETGPGPDKEEASCSPVRPKSADAIGRGKAAEATGKVRTKESSRPGTDGKPVYRVGLSKRLRIAPLLKSLPK